MTTHIIKPNTPVDMLAMRCGLLASDATDSDHVGSDGNSDWVRDLAGILRRHRRAMGDRDRPQG